MNRVAAMFACFALAGCATAPAGNAQAVDAGAEVTLAPGETASVNAAEIKVRFISVIDDSRCPRDVTCVWAGEVRLLLEMQTARGPQPIEIRERGSAIAGGYRVTLLQVEPQPMSTAKIAPQEYRAKIVIEKAA
jgi:hypothetical protein